MYVALSFRCKSLEFSNSNISETIFSDPVMVLIFLSNAELIMVCAMSIAFLLEILFNFSSYVPPNVLDFTLYGNPLQKLFDCNPDVVFFPFSINFSISPFFVV